MASPQDQPVASDLLKELRPLLPLSTRFCVVGGGPSGLSAAYALWRLGYEHITVLEKHHTVAGMCETVEVEGRNYDLGGQVVARESAPNIKHLAEVAKVDMEELAAHKLALVDCNTGEYEDLKIAKDYVSIMQLTLELQAQAAATGRLGVHALSNLAPDNSLEFVSNKGIKELPKAVAAGFTASGYGYPQDMPYAYLHEFIRTSMFGKVLRVRGGYTSLWQGIASLLPYVRCNTAATSIERLEDQVKVHVKDLKTGEDELLEFDKIIISGTAAFTSNGPTYRSSAAVQDCSDKKHLLTCSQKEIDTFGKVRTIEYYTTVLKVAGFNKFPAGFYYCNNYVEDPETIGHPVAFQRFYPDTDIYLFWSYGNFEVSQQEMTRLLFQDVESMGGTVETLILQRKWNYFPHISSQDMKEGLYDKLEALQGCQNTYYVGGLFAFELTERNAAFAMDLMARHFGTREERPHFKNLIGIPGQPEGNYELEHLTELEEFEFPDLPCLDAYLSFYAKHNVLKDRILYTWLNDKGEESDKRTYAQLDSRANTVAHGLLTSKLGIKNGDRVMLLYMPGLEFIEAFFGCLRAQVLPVPLIPPDIRQGTSSHALAKVENVAKACGAKAILSTVAYHTAVRASGIRDTLSRMQLSPRKMVHNWPKLPWLHTDSWVNNATKKTQYDEQVPTRVHPVEEDETCFLQFTSGSTGDAKGVMITHRGLIHNVKLMKRMYKSTSRTVLVSWLPQYHDMGLIGGLFTALVSGGTAILFSPTTFIRKPLLWLDTLSKYAATHSAGPNFAFELSVKKLELLQKSGKQLPKYDLSCLRFLMASAEPVRANTLQRFLGILEDSGLKEQVLAPGYGLAENCVFVCVAWGHGKPILVDWQGRVCCGYVEKGNKDADIRIVNPETCEEVGDGVEGELWVKSPSSGAGYWGLKELSRVTFGARIANGDENDRFLRTGDLARLIGGMLFITGRIKDLIIIRGRNIYPSDIEKTVEASSEALRPGCCAAFGAPPDALKSRGIQIDDSVQDVGLVVVAEVRDVSKVDAEVLASQIASTVANEHGVNVASVSLIKPRTILKTTSGKIRRLECLKQFKEGSLESINPNWEKKKKILSLRRSRTLPGRTSQCSLLSPVAPPTSLLLSKVDVTNFLIRMVAERLGIPEAQIQTTRSFLDYGLDSTSVVWTAQKLSSFLGIHVGAIEIYTAGCITELADIIEGLQKKSEGASQATTGSLAKNPVAVVENSSSKPSKEEIQNFILQMISERTGVKVADLSVIQSLAEYGLDSIAVVWAAQKLSSFLGIHIAAINIYTASCISELCDIVEDLLTKEKPTQSRSSTGLLHKEVRASNTAEYVNVDDFESELISEAQLESGVQPSFQRQMVISLLQFLAIVYIAFLFLMPAALIFKKVAIVFTAWSSSWSLILSVLLVPLAWLVYISVMAVTLRYVGRNMFLPNFYLQSSIPLWSVDFVKWWTHYRLQDFASNMVAVHLRGTIFLNWWYRLLGAQIGNNVQLDTTDITDPSLLIIADDAVVGEGATLQSHEVKQGVVELKPIRIGRGAVVGPYSFIGMGSTLKAAAVCTLGKIDGNMQQGVTKDQNLSSSLQDNSQRMSSLVLALYQVMGLYIVSLASAISGAMAYITLKWLVEELDILPNDLSLRSAVHESRAGYLIFSLMGAFPWAITSAVPLATCQNPGFLFDLLWGILMKGRLVASIFCIGVAYVAYGLSICAITCALKWILVGKLQGKMSVQRASHLGFRIWLVQRLLASAHMKFVMVLSGTEILCTYLRSLGAKIGQFASIRGVNAIVDPDLIELGNSSHLGDFAKILTSMSTGKDCMALGKIQVGAGCVVGAQSVVMLGATIEDSAWLGAMSVAKQDCTLKQGGVYLGVENPIMIYNHLPKEEEAESIPANDSRIASMDPSYRKIVANLSAHIVKASQSVNSRYFHRAGIAGKGTMTMLNELNGLPAHDIFSPGKTYSVVVRHSNSLSSDDDARPDARGASLRILQAGDGKTVDDAILDLTLKTGKAFYARNILNFVTWLTKGIKEREGIVKANPHIGDAVWDSLRLGNSYAEMHYYSNVCRLFRSTSTEECYVKFRMRPLDSRFAEDEGSIERNGLLPPETGALPRDENEQRSAQFMRDDFRKRLLSSEGVHYMFQVQLHSIPASPAECEDVMDCTRAWDDEAFPYIDVGVIHLNELLESEEMRFNPRNGVPSLDMIPATSLLDSASIDHGRSVAYDLAQYIRNGMTLPPAWKALLKEADVAVSIPAGESGCPALSGCLPDNVVVKTRPTITELSKPSIGKVGGARDFQGLNLLIVRSIQPLLQVTSPVMILALSQFAALLPASYLASKVHKDWTLAFVPLAYIASAMVFSILSLIARRVLLGITKDGETSELWGFKSLKDTTWQAINVILSGYFLDLTKGSMFCTSYLRSMGACISDGGVIYMDTLFALNPDLLQVGSGSTIGRNALLFGHLYEGGKVNFGSNVVGDYAFVGTRSLLLPASRMEDGSDLRPLTLAMKNEVVRNAKS